MGAAHHVRGLLTMYPFSLSSAATTNATAVALAQVKVLADWE